MATVRLICTTLLLLVASRVAFSQSLTERLNDVRFVDDSIVIAVGDAGLILRSTNGGASWARLHDLLADTLEEISFSGKFGVVSARDGKDHFFLSDDAGISWRTVQSNGIGNVVRLSEAQLVGTKGPVNDRYDIRWSATRFAKATLLYSPDLGVHWIPKTPTPPQQGGDFYVDSPAFLYEVRCKNQYTFVTGSYNVASHKDGFFGIPVDLSLISIDSGVTWSMQTRTQHIRGFHDLSGNHGDFGIGVLNPNHPQEAVIADRSYFLSPVSLVGFDDSVFVVCTHHDTLYRTSTAGVIWDTLFLPTKAIPSSIHARGALGLIVGERGQIFRSTDYGLHWNESDTITEYLQVPNVQTHDLFLQRINPSSQGIELTVSAGSRCNATITINDEVGRVVSLQNAELLWGANVIHLDRPDLASGSYFLRIQGSGESLVAKFAK